jgi:hypothetical protein
MNTLPAAAAARQKKDLEGRIVKDGVRKAIQDRQIVLTDLVHAVREYRRLAETTDAKRLERVFFTTPPLYFGPDISLGPLTDFRWK